MKVHRNANRKMSIELHASEANGFHRFQIQEIRQSLLKQITGYSLDIGNKRIGRAARCLTKLMRCGDMLSYPLGAKIPSEFICIHNID
ncbi:hypothetical protein Q9233_017099 [Columba guinea]|nr:hypothetical protein Q9233_017099 [Columba guinea]